MRVRNFFKTIIVLAWGIAMAGCGTDKVEPANMPVPEVLTVNAEAQVSSADINAVIASSESATGCGFYFGKQHDNMQRIECTVIGDCICAHIDSLEASTLYYFMAFVDNGVNEIRSSLNTFKTKPIPESDDDSEQEDDPDPDNEPEPGPDEEPDDEPEVDPEPDDPEPEVDPEPAVPADSIVNIEDEGLRAYLVWQYDLDGDGQLSYYEAAQEQTLDYCTDNLETMTGLEAFVNLYHLDLSGTRNGNIGHGKIREIDLRTMPYMQSVNFAHNMNLKHVDLSGCPLLYVFEACLSGLDSLDVSHNPNINMINMEDNHMKFMDASAVINLNYMSLNNNELEWVNVAGLDNLEELKLDGNRLRELDISKCRHLKVLTCLNNPQLEVIYMAKGQVLNILQKDDHTRIVIVE